MTIEELQNVTLLSKIEPTVLERCLMKNQARVRHYVKGKTVYHQQDTCTSLDVVLSGNLAAYSLSENGSGNIMFEFQKASIIGANLLFSEKSSYPLSIYCVTACDLLHLSREAVLEFLHDYHFVMQYIESLSSNSFGMNRKITMLSQKTLRENLMDFLKQQSVLQGSCKITLPFSKKELADYLGVQRPSLFRELKKLKDEGIIEIDHRIFHLINAHQ